MTGESIVVNIGLWLIGKVADKGFDALVNKLRDTDEINKKFKAAVVKVSETYQKEHPTLLGGSIEYFFKKEEVFNELFKLLFRASKIDESKIKSIFDTTSLPPIFIENFIISLREELLKDRIFDEIFSNNEIFVVFQGMGLNVQTIAKNSEISIQQLSTITKILENRIEGNFDIDEFKRLYSKNAINSLSQLSFIGLGIDISIKKNRKNLMDIFVSPLFESFNGQTTSFNTKVHTHIDSLIQYEDLFKISKRLVILGNPGSGKSIVLKSIICDILSGKSERFHGMLTNSLPFRIELRNYLVFKKETRGNFVKYLTSLLESDYQISKITESVIVDILSNEECLILFDGLDEIFDVTDKISTKNDIENFHNTFPKINSITTSRIIGYEEAGLNDEFTPIYIRNFDDDQIREYVNKWYEKEEDICEIRDREVNGFISKMHEIDFELISNPLLLSLIVIIYRNILKLPESKLEIYQSCTKTLVEKWDASKELVINLDPKLLKEKDKLFADLAHWQYNQLSGKSTSITYGKAKQTVADSIQRLNISTEEDSDQLSEAFMEYAQKRSLYFDNNFTHKTFLEYYTAYWIYSNIEKKHLVSLRDELITKYIGNPFWFIVLELLLNLIDKDQADNDIIDGIFNDQLMNTTQGVPFLLDMAFKLKNISDETIKKSISVGIEYLYKIRPVKKSHHTSENSLFRSLTRIYNQSSKAKTFTIEELKKLEREKEGDIKELAYVYILYNEIANNIHGESTDRFLMDNPENYSLATKCNAYLFLLDKSIYYPHPQRILDSIEEFVKLFGIEKIFDNLASVYDSYEFSSYFETIINLTLTKEVHNIDENLEILRNFGLTNKDILQKISENNVVYFSLHTNYDNILKEFETNANMELSEIIISTLIRDSNFDRSAIKIDSLNEQKKKLVSNLIAKHKTGNMPF